MTAVAPKAPFAPGPIALGREVPLSASSSGQPVMEAILDWFRPMTIGVVSSKPQGGADPAAAGVTRQSTREVKTEGCLQAGDGEKLEILDEGERSIASGLLHTTPDFNVPNDSAIVIDKVRFRVMSKKDFSVNGFIRYEITQDYERAR